jgi:hypothetical protein
MFMFFSSLLAVFFWLALALLGLLGFERDFWRVVMILVSIFNVGIFSWIALDEGSKIKRWSPGNPSVLIQEAPHTNKDHRRGELWKHGVGR